MVKSGRLMAAASLLICLLPSITAASCAAAGRSARGVDAGGAPDSGGVEGPGAAGEQEASLDGREIAEYLRENPGDPSRAGLEQFLSMSAFTEAAARGGEDGRPGARRAGSAVCRYTEGMISGSGPRRSEAYCAADAAGWQGLCRARRAAPGGSAVSWYLSGEALSGAVRLHGGAMVPDFALGLVFGGSGGSSLTSGAFPFHAARMIAGTTSFSTPSMRGGAVEIRGRCAYAAAFCGRRMTYGPDGPEAGREEAGARIEARRGRIEAGLSVSTGTPDSGARVFAIDGRWRSEGMNAGFEAGLGGSREPALLSAFSCGISKTRAGLMLYFVPPGSAGAFGSLIGRSPGSVSSIGGAAAAVERALPRHFRVRASLDRYERADGYDAMVRQTAGIECERRGKKGFLKLVWSGAAEERRDLVPYPAADEIRLSGSHALGVQGEWRIGRKARVGAALKRIDDERGLGWLVAPVLRANLLTDRLRVTASIADYETVFGTPICYLYEPALPGSFPLRIVSRDTVRGAVLIGLYINRLSILLHAALEVGTAPELSLQAAARL